MSWLPSLRGVVSRQSPLSSTMSPPTMASRLFSTSSSLLARQAPKPTKSSSAAGSAKAAKRKRNAPKSENYSRVKILKQNMFSPAPPPLRMGRLRYLRHWTIHRAWQLFRRQQNEATEKERNRMHAGMYNACEELRQTVGPEGRGEGYLYRVAMEKKGVWGTKAVPIEYARLQTDTPAREAWNHGWTR